MRPLLAILLMVGSVLGCDEIREATAQRRKVWVVNALDVPLDVTVASERVRVEGQSHRSVETAARDIEFVAMTTSGREVDRARVRTKPDSKVAYNVLGASPFIIYKETYVPPSRQHFPIIGDDAMFPEPTFLQKIVERSDIDFFLEPGPVVLQTEKPGQQDRMTMQSAGDWKATVAFLSAKGRYADALKFAQTIAAIQPDDAGARQVVERLTPRPRAETQTIVEVAALPAGWSARSRDGRAHVQQNPVGPGMCNTACSMGSKNIWTVNECLARSGGYRFVSNDCRHLAVLRLLGEGSWRYSPVMFFYTDGRLQKSMTAGDFVSDETLIRTVSDTHFTWVKGEARVSQDGTIIEFQTEDGRSRRVRLDGK